MDRVKQGLQVGLWINVALAVFFGALCVLFHHAILRVFMDGSDRDMMDVGRSFLMLVPCSYWLIAIKLSCDGVLHGAGAARTFLISTLLDLLSRVVVAFILAPFMGYWGVWISWPIGYLIGTAFSVIYYLRGDWKTAKRLN